MTASADIIVSFDNTSLSAGGFGFIDVLISSTASNPLQFASYDFLITGSTLNGALQFRATQLNTEQSVMGPPGPDYVFLGDTDSGNFFANRDPGDFTSLTGSDLTLSGGNATVSTTNALLARLELEHISGTPLAAVGDTFMIQLVNQDQANADPFDDSTLFLDDAFNVQDIAPSAFTNFGTITITSSAAVPEPGTFAVLAVAAIGFAGRRLRKKRTDALRAESSGHCSQS